MKKRALSLAMAVTMAVPFNAGISSNAAELPSDFEEEVVEEVATETDSDDTDALSEGEEDVAYGLTYHDIDKKFSYTPSAEVMANYGTLPAAYDSRTKGFVSPVKDQNPYGSCWSFAATGSMEGSMLAQGYAKTAPDYSELHLAYFFYHHPTDPLGLTAGDTTTPMQDHFLDQGGNNLLTIWSMASWVGSADESVAPYSTANPSMTISPSLGYKDSAHLQNAFIVPNENSNDVKSLIMKYGTLACSIYMTTSYNYFDSSNNALYVPGYTSTNHAVELIGWDDNYSASKFSSYNRPSKNGAWLIKNSWGPGSYNYDYIWVSYEDGPMLNGASVAYVGEPASNYDFNYQYDSTGSYSSAPVYNGSTVANVYTVAGSATESLKAVGFGLDATNTNYSIQIYKNPTSGNPLSGTKMLSTPVTGKTSYAGYYTVKLPTPISLKKGDKFTVAITVSDGDGYSGLYFMTDESRSYGWISFNSKTAPGQSYLIENGSVTDMHSNESCFRIKAYTKAESSAPAKPAAVKDFKVVSTSDSAIKLGWSRNSAATGYVIQQYVSGSWKSIKKITSNATVVYKVDNLKKATTYKFRIYAYNESNGQSVLSDPVSVAGDTNISPMTAFKVSNTTKDKAKLTWTRHSGANGYVIEQKIGDTWTKIKTIADKDTTSYVVTGLKDATEYAFRIRAYYTSSKNYFSAYLGAKGRTLPADMTKLSVGRTTKTAIEIKWTANKRVDGYVVYQKQSGKWVKIATVKGGATSSYIISKLPACAVQSFAVKPYTIYGGTAYYGGFATITTATRLYDLSGVKVASHNSSAIKLTWDANKVATGYFVQQYVNGAWKNIQTVKGQTTTTAKVSGLKAGTAYKFRLCAYNDNNSACTKISEYVEITGVTDKASYAVVYNGVNYSAVYNYNYYVNTHPDIAKTFGANDTAALAHFVNNGMKEGRQASTEFNVAVYKARYSDLRSAYGNDLVKYYMHYINYGKKEGRKGN